MKGAALALLLSFMPLAAIAQTVAPGVASTERRPPVIRLMTPNASIPHQGFAPAPRDQPAPMPDRRLEAPQPKQESGGPALEPTLILPGTTSRGHTFGREHAPDRDERLFREVIPGARLRIPLQ